MLRTWGLAEGILRRAVTSTCFQQSGKVAVLREVLMMEVGAVLIVVLSRL